MIKQLTLFDLQKLSLNQLEEIVARGLSSFIETGMALLVIREEKKYKEIGYSTFEAYLKDRWGISRPYAYSQIDSGYIANDLSSIADKNRYPIPTAESQLRPLTRFGNALNPAPEQWAEAWIKACEIAEGKVPTAREVDFVVKEMLWHEPVPNYAPQIHKIYKCKPTDLRNSFQQYTKDYRKDIQIQFIETDNIKSTLIVLIPWKYCEGIFQIYDAP